MKSYSESDIKVLSDRDHVRLRLPVYAGRTSKAEYDIPVFNEDGFNVTTVEFVPAAYKCVDEIINNCVDELSQIDIKQKIIEIQADPILGTYTISDNGRGVPIGKHQSGKHVPEVVFGSLRSGRNFTEDKAAGVIGMNGMGAAITNFCSTEFSIDIHRDGKRYRQKFTRGGTNVTKPSVRKSTSKKQGTTISFQLDSEVFDDPTLPPILMESRARELALTNPGLVVKYNNKKFVFRQGFETLIKKISNDYYVFRSNNIEFFVIFDVNEGIDEQIYSWVNSSLLFDGGICNTQFLNAFYDATIRHLEKEAKKNKCQVTKNDIRQQLLVIGNLKLQDPEYDAQSKTRLTGPNLRKEMNQLISDNWKQFTRKHKSWLSSVIDRAIVRHHTTANKKAIKEHQKKLSRRIPGLKDATSKDRSQCQLIVTEGDSAAGMITDVRDPKTIGVLPLRGKINNVYGVTVAQLLNMGKVTDLITALGLIPGKRAVRSELRYGRLILATDSDYDGGDIFTLLVNLFYQFWPELFDPRYPPFLYRLIAPNICVTKGKKRKHFATREAFEKQKTKYSTWSVQYYKGLGSMVRADWEMILSTTDTWIPVTDDGNLQQTLSLLFSNDSNARKRWLT